MQEFLLTIIAGLLSVQTGAFAWLVARVWQHEGRIKGVEDAQQYCPGHFKPGGSV